MTLLSPRRRSGFTRSVNTAGACCMSGATSTTAVKLSLGISAGGSSTFDSLIVQTLSMETSQRKPSTKRSAIYWLRRVRAIGKTPNDPRDLPLVVLQPALQNCIFDDVDAAVEPKLPHGVGFVRFDRLHAEGEPGGDFLVAVAGGNQTQDF